MLVGETLERVDRAGKYTVWSFTHGKGMILHLMMTGQLHWLRKDETPSRSDFIWMMDMESHSLWFRDPRRFGKMWVGHLADLKSMERITHLGPDAFTISMERLTELFATPKNKRMKLKEMLLNQRMISGIGNIYGDEICARAKILPIRKVGEITGAEQIKLWDWIIRTLNRSLELGGSSIKDYIHIDGKKGTFSSEFIVFGRKTCVACSGPIEKQILAGRYSHFCRNCQI